MFLGRLSPQPNKPTSESRPAVLSSSNLGDFEPEFVSAEYSAARDSASEEYTEPDATITETINTNDILTAANLGPYMERQELIKVSVDNRKN
jgi:hypothetical protein